MVLANFSAIKSCSRRLCHIYGLGVKGDYYIICNPLIITSEWAAQSGGRALFTRSVSYLFNEQESPNHSTLASLVLFCLLWWYELAQASTSRWSISMYKGVYANKANSQLTNSVVALIFHLSCPVH